MRRIIYKLFFLAGICVSIPCLNNSSSIAIDYISVSTMPDLKDTDNKDNSKETANKNNNSDNKYQLKVKNHSSHHSHYSHVSSWSSPKKQVGTMPGRSDYEQPHIGIAGHVKRNGQICGCTGLRKKPRCLSRAFMVRAKAAKAPARSSISTP